MLYLWLVLRARWKDGDAPTRAGHIVRLKRGQVLVGAEQVERELSAPQLRFTRERYRTALDHLERTGEITTKSTYKGTIVTVTRMLDPERNAAAADSEGNRPGNPERRRHRSAEGTDKGATIEEGLQDGREKESKSVSAPADTNTHESLISSAWNAAVGQELVWTWRRRAQVRRLLEHYELERILTALAKYKAIRAIKNPYPPREGPHYWSPEAFFTAARLDTVLNQPLGYFEVPRPRRPDRDVIGDTNLDDYDREQEGAEIDGD